MMLWNNTLRATAAALTLCLVAFLGGCSLRSPRVVSAGVPRASTPVNTGPGLVFGSDYEVTFVHMSPSAQAATMAKVAAAGIRWLRVDVSSDHGSWWTEPVIRAARAAGIEVDALLTDYEPVMGNPAAVGAFARQAVEHYAPMGVHTYELGNELNYDQGPAVYTADLCAAAGQIRSADSRGFVLASGMGPSDSPWPVDYLDRMYQAGAKDCMDAANMHPYSFPDQPMQPDDWNSFYNLPKLHQVMVNHGDGNKKIWLTEFGAPTFGNPTDNGSVSETEQAKMITGAFAQMRQWSWAGPLFVFNWIDSRDGAFGMMRADGSPKPAYSALVTATHQ